MTQSFSTEGYGSSHDATDDNSPPKPEEHTLLKTKLFIPTARSRIVPRPALLEQLTRGMQHRLTLLSAPAGSGKTTALSAWAQQSACPVAWVTLAKGDNEPLRFWRYLIAAVETLYKGIGEDALRLLQAPRLPPYETILTALINTLADLPDPFALILDDYQVITHPAIQKALSFLLDRLPPCMHLFIASRTRLSVLLLPRLRACGQMLELSATELHFTLAETKAFFTQTMNVTPSAETIEALHMRTEGWAVGLQLAALALQLLGEHSECVLHGHGDIPSIVEYLMDEVFRRQPAHIQAFLLSTAFFECFTASLCDALTDNHDGQESLNYLEQENIFLTAVDSEKHWYRYHQIFAAFLRRLAQEKNPASIPLLHQKASLWYEHHDFLTQAKEKLHASWQSTML